MSSALPLRAAARCTSLVRGAKTIGEAKSRMRFGPFSWQAGVLCLVTLGGLMIYFENEKKRMHQKRIAEANKQIGRPKIGGPFELLDQNGKLFSSEDLKGRYSLVYFGFTHCPDICPEELDKMAEMMNIVNKKIPGSVKPVFITCDPARDGPAELKTYLAEFDSNLVGLTGTYEQIKAVCKSYRVYFSTPSKVKPGEDYLVDHSIYFYLMDPNGDFVEALGRQHSPQAAADIIQGHPQTCYRARFDPPHFVFTPQACYCFNIDGVLLHVAKPIPGAAESLQYLTNNKIPFILLTNGGGKHESDRVSDLASKLGVRLSTENFVQSHTPFQDLVDNSEGLREKTILVTGADAHKCRQIAEAYGFQSVVTPADILAAQPNIYPFQTLMTEVYANTWRPLPKPLYNPDQPTADALKIDAVFVFNDPRDWSLDIQIITDILQSHNGIIGTYSPKNGKSSLPNNGWQGDGQPRVYFSNPDLLWAAHFHQPRLGQGAFQASLDGVWRAITGGHSLQRGKPGDTVDSLHNVYMVGDNPESDIRGANEFRSLLFQMCARQLDGP
ncbi:Protein SCO1 mitochondrial [Ceratocystis platani]|uniref:Protein SCO1 mitochondrial n=1 Tax=Ceratocystis fimbriata f. sp. platani TaxID=88771 RepID=A0A0F8CXW2_CERFI|nr:Protein SCO1 mitochondrial [Ceratocystis platani]